MTLPLGEWQPGRWWRVKAPNGSVWCETSDEQEARHDMRSGHTLERLYVKEDRVWHAVEHIEDADEMRLKVTVPPNDLGRVPTEARGRQPHPIVGDDDWYEYNEAQRIKAQRVGIDDPPPFPPFSLRAVRDLWRWLCEDVGHRPGDPDE